MRLIKVSDNNRCFLFEDRQIQVFRAYRLERTSVKSVSRNKMQTRNSVYCAECTYFFKPLFEIDVMKLKMVSKFFRKKKVDYAEVVYHITNCGQLKIDDFGNIDMTFNSFKPRRKRDCDISNKFWIYISILRRSKEVKNSKLA